MLPPLAKYHSRAEAGDVRLRATRDCERSVDADAIELRIEREIYAAAAARLDATFRELRAAGVDVAALLAAFEAHLALAMTAGADHKIKAMGRVDSAAGLDTLIMSDCVRKCAVDALDRAVRLAYPGPEAPRPFANRSLHKNFTGA